jgi:hypothetical protein
VEVGGSQSCSSGENRPDLKRPGHPGHPTLERSESLNATLKLRPFKMIVQEVTRVIEILLRRSPSPHWLPFVGV